MLGQGKERGEQNTFTVNEGKEEQEKERGSRGVLEEGKDCLIWDKGKDGKRGAGKGVWEEEQARQCWEKRSTEWGSRRGRRRGREGSMSEAGSIKKAGCMHANGKEVAVRQDD